MDVFMKRFLTVFALAIALGFGVFAAEPAPENSKLARYGPLAGKLDTNLIPAVEALHEGKATAAALTRELQRSLARALPPSPTGKLALTLDVPKVDAAMLKSIEDSGANVLNSSEQWNSVSVLASLTEIDALTQMPGVRHIALARRAIHRQQGTSPNEADHSMQTDLARAQTGLTGNGVKIGVLALSCNQSAAFQAAGVVTNGNLTMLPDQVSGDLPASIQLVDPGPAPGFILPDGSSFDPGSDYNDEGAAMMELIHDIAPNASLAFASGEYDQTTFAANITKLQQANCKITVDDVGYPDEPFFQDGPVAQAIRTGFNKGIAHFSAVGNDGDAGVLGSYSPINSAAPTDPNFVYPSGNYFHQWNISTATPGFLPIDVPDGSGINVILQWNQPFMSYGLGAGSTVDLDLLLFFDTSDPTAYIASSADPQGSPGAPSGDPIEIIDPVMYTNNTGATQRVYLAINSPNGNVAATQFRVVIQSDLQLSFPSGGAGQMTAFGHTTLPETIAVGAIFFPDIDSGGKVINPGEDPNAVNAELFSSKGGIVSTGGGVPFYFDTTGNPLPNAPQLRDAPAIAAPDGCSTTFFGNPYTATVGTTTYNLQFSFSGTSAAASNAAAVAALLLERASLSTPTQLRLALQATATDIVAAAPVSAVGPDDLTGAGLISGLDAVNAVPGILTNPSNQSILAGDNVSFSITATGTAPLTYQWQKNGQDIIGETGTINGSQPAMLNLTNEPYSDNSSTYRCVVSNTLGTAVSGSALLTVEPRPVITVQPTDLIVTIGFPATFTLQATNALHYQWQRDGQDIPGAPDAPSYTLASVALSDNNAMFQCLVSNLFATTPSDVVSLTVNTLPAIISGPTATPAAATIGQSVQFSATAAGARGQAVTYNWDFGDGNTGSGPTVTHAYAAAENYTVTLTVTDTIGANSVRTLIEIIFTDSNGDGQPDLNPAVDDTSFVDAYEGVNAFPEQTLSIVKMSIGLDFKKRGMDTLSVNGTLLIPAGFTSAGKQVISVIGGVGRMFTLSAKGKATATPNGTFALAFNAKAKGAQFAKYTLKLAKADIQGIVAGSGLLNTNAKNEAHTVRATIFFNDNMFDKLQPQIYTAKQGQSGKTR